MAHSGPRGLGVRPFRGLRFVPDKVADPAAVTSPPYDMIGPAEAQRLADTEEHNVVRLILPSAGTAAGTAAGAAAEAVGGDGSGGSGPGYPVARYRRAASSLAEWMAAGALGLDADPAFYVYEQTGPGGHQRGLVALVELDGEPADTDPAAGDSPAGDPSDGDTPGAGLSILPHEAVVPVVVDDRLAQMLATEANIEPILLTYGGDPAVSDLLDDAADRGAPVSAVTTADGTRHRLWAVADPARVAEIAERLARHRALIADGHHRHAAYRKLRAALLGSEPTRYGLALLVDSARYPLSLHAIHRVLPKLPLDVAVAAAERVFTVREIGPDHQRELDAAPPDEHVFVLSDGARSFLLSRPDPEVLATAIPAGRPAVWRSLDATVLHHVLVESVWKLPDTPQDVRFDHDPGHAVAHAAEVGGTAVLLRPTTEAVVRELAGAGVLMPRKSTAFGPKPATGLVMRLLDERRG